MTMMCFCDQNALSAFHQPEKNPCSPQSPSTNARSRSTPVSLAHPLPTESFSFCAISNAGTSLLFARKQRLRNGQGHTRQSAFHSTRACVCHISGSYQAVESRMRVMWTSTGVACTCDRYDVLQRESHTNETDAWPERTATMSEHRCSDQFLQVFGVLIVRVRLTTVCVADFGGFGYRKQKQGSCQVAKKGMM